jgi:hypothetical protein
MSEPQAEKPKIIVDEDWKAQVEAERETLRQQETKPDQPANPEQPARSDRTNTSEQQETAEPVQRDRQDERRALPPASFGTLVNMLAAQAIAALGQIPDPLDGKPVVRLELARHTIDTLDVLEQKTKGNLAPAEENLLENVLHELRMLYVHVQKLPPPPEAKS